MEPQELELIGDKIAEIALRRMDGTGKLHFWGKTQDSVNHKLLSNFGMGAVAIHLGLNPIAYRGQVNHVKIWGSTFEHHLGLLCHKHGIDYAVKYSIEVFKEYTLDGEIAFDDFLRKINKQYADYKKANYEYPYNSPEQ
jgi:hypothetical protein